MSAEERRLPAGGAWDTFSDTWVATDALGRRLPTYEEVGPPRPDRFVGIFYFLWLGAHVNGGPWDVTKILAQDPQAMQKKDSPLWGPMYAPHHWASRSSATTWPTMPTCCASTHRCSPTPGPGDVDEFTVDGDAAPNGRFNYRYVVK